MLRRHILTALQVCQKSRNVIGQMQQKRTEVIFKRMFPYRDMTELEMRDHKNEPFVYIMEENTRNKPAGDMQVILTTDIEEVGVEGELVTVSKRIARNNLLPLGMAVYASPENMAKYEEIRQRLSGIPKQTKTGQRTVKQLAAMTLPIPMNPNVSWILTKQHVRIALRKVGVYLKNSSITLPKEPVKEMGEIQIKIKVNDIDDVTVNAVVYALSKDTQIPETFEVWQDTSVTIDEIIEKTYLKLAAKGQHLKR